MTSLTCSIQARRRAGLRTGGLLQNELVQRQVGDRLAQTGILRLQLLQALDLLGLQPAVLLPPPILIGPEIYRHYYLDMRIRIDSKGS
jgi:hypothetical protein